MVIPNLLHLATSALHASTVESSAPVQQDPVEVAMLPLPYISGARATLTPDSVLHSCLILVTCLAPILFVRGDASGVCVPDHHRITVPLPPPVPAALLQQASCGHRCKSVWCLCMQLGTHLRAKKKREELGALIRRAKK